MLSPGSVRLPEQTRAEISLIYDVGGDWVALYVNGELRFQGHAISDDQWKTLLVELGATTNDYQESNIASNGEGAPYYLKDVKVTNG